MNENDFNTIRWSCTVGVNAGYDLDTQANMAIEQFTEIYQKVAAQVYETTGVYISAVITPSRVVYHSEWGCPADGEFSYTISGSCNREFTTPEEYHKALFVLANRLKEALHQSTLLLEIVPARLIYLK